MHFVLFSLLYFCRVKIIKLDVTSDEDLACAFERISTEVSDAGSSQIDVYLNVF